MTTNDKIQRPLCRAAHDDEDASCSVVNPSSTRLSISRFRFAGAVLPLWPQSNRELTVPTTIYDDMSNPKSMKPTGQTSKGGRKKVKQWHCDESVESTIREAIIATPFALKAYDPGIFISYGSDENIHEVLGFHQLPAGLIQQVTANASATHFKTW